MTDEILETEKLSIAEDFMRQEMKTLPDHVRERWEHEIQSARPENYEAAIAMFEKSLAGDRQSAMFNFRIGQHFEYLKCLNTALYHYRRSLRFAPDDYFTIIQIGRTYRKTGALDHAVKAFWKAFRLRPVSVDALNELSLTLRDQSMFDQAARMCQRALLIAPATPEIYNNLGTIEFNRKNYVQALNAYRKAIDLKPDFVEAHFNMGNLLNHCGRYHEALAAFQSASEHNPDFYSAVVNIGSIHRIMGDHDAASTAYKRAIRIDADRTRAYRELSAVRKFRTRDRFIKAMESLLNMPALNVQDRITLNFALGKAYEDLALYDHAFAHLTAGNRLKRQTFSYNHESTHRLVENLKSAFHQIGDTGNGGYGCDDRTPIFIVGMPRSGTSLVEQVLASHPDVFGGGELPTLDKIVSTYAKRILKSRYPECIAGLPEQAYREMGEAYINQVRKFDRGHHRITDKMPQNFWFVGLIKRILPNATVIHCRRNPMDNCLSIYKNDFSRLHPYAYDLLELGHYYRQYMALMEHWQKILPGFIHDVSYEGMVTDPDGTISALLEFCNLTKNDQCVRFYQSKRPVLTASTAQVRKPIYKDSVELWRKYGDCLDLLRDCILGKGLLYRHSGS